MIARSVDGNCHDDSDNDENIGLLHYDEEKTHDGWSIDSVGVIISHSLSLVHRRRHITRNI